MVVPMRILLAGCLVLCSLFGAAAQTVDDQSGTGIEAETLGALLALATRDFADPGAAHLRNIHRSLARNGQGYCGEVSLAESGEFTVFHAILEGGTGPSVLRMVDFPESDQSSSATTVRRMMKNFGCVE